MTPEDPKAEDRRPKDHQPEDHQPEDPTVRAWIKENPWIWLLIIVFMFLSANAIFLKIAMSLPLEIIG